VNQNGELFSSVMDHPTLCVRYKPNKWVKAHPVAARLGYHLLVYNDIDIARGSCIIDPSVEIWEVECKGKINNARLHAYHVINRYGVTVISDDIMSISTSIMDGVEMFEKVRLIRKVS